MNSPCPIIPIVKNETQGNNPAVFERTGTIPNSYPKSFKDRAVRMVADRLEDEWGGIAPELGIATETLRRWFVQAEADAGKKPDVPMDEQAQIRRLKQEDAELRQVNEILRTASALSPPRATGPLKPATPVRGHAKMGC